MRYFIGLAVAFWVWLGAGFLATPSTPTQWLVYAILGALWLATTFGLLLPDEPHDPPSPDTYYNASPVLDEHYEDGH